MTRRSIRRIAAVTALVAGLAALPAEARTQTFQMIPVNGATAEGVVSFEFKNRGEIFRVRVFDRKPDGTLYEVRAIIDGAEMPIGRVQLTLQSGILEIDSKNIFSPVFPLRDVQQISVLVEGRETVLEVRIP